MFLLTVLDDISNAAEKLIFLWLICIYLCVDSFTHEQLRLACFGEVFFIKLFIYCISVDNVSG